MAKQCITCKRKYDKNIPDISYRFPKIQALRIQYPMAECMWFRRKRHNLRFHYEAKKKAEKTVRVRHRLDKFQVYKEAALFQNE